MTSNRGVTHILWLNEWPGRRPFSGAENHLFILLPALAARGVDTELLVLTLAYGDEVTQKLRDLERSGVRVTVVRCSTARGLRWLGFRKPDHILQLRRELQTRRSRIIHLHLDRIVPVVAARLAGCRRVVMSIHADEPWLRSVRWRVWLRLADRLISRYIAITNYVAQFYASASGVAADKIDTVYYGVEPDQRARPRAQVRKELGIDEHAYVVGFVGRLAPQKNLPVLIAALARIREVRGIVIGDGPLRPKLEALAVASRAPVTFLGYRDAATDLIPAFDLFCLPSSFEGLGLVLIEAILQKVPVVASRAGAIPEVLGGGEYGVLFDHESIDQLEAAIRCLRAHPDAAVTMADRALVYARRAFSVQAMARHTIEAYAKVN
jgi:glycosyltransferase involved in cell wall biosynthesis